MPSSALLRRIRTIAAEFPPARWVVRGAARLVAPRHPVGAVGVVFDDEGRVLILEHAFRTDFPWGLPGGWVERGEEPRDTVRRELCEELRLDVEVRDLVHCATIGRVRTSTHPVHLGLAYYCELNSDEAARSMEVLGFEWMEPESRVREIAPFQQAAVDRAVELRRRLTSGSVKTGRS